MAETRRVEMIMGTAVDIDARHVECSQDDLDVMVETAFARLSEIEQVFSTYIRDSEISRFGRGELSFAELTDDVREILDICDKVHAASNGYFDIYAAARNPPAAEHQRSSIEGARAIEPSGVVKGWAIEKAVEILRDGGVRDFCVNAGGDLYVSGDQYPGEPWRIGLQHPFDKAHTMAVLDVRDTAIATSGIYERGEHITRPDGTIPSGLVSVTIVGADITLADAFATATFAMGLEGLRWASDLPGFHVFAVDEDNNTHFSTGMNEYLVRES